MLLNEHKNHRPHWMDEPKIEKRTEYKISVQTLDGVRAVRALVAQGWTPTALPTNLNGECVDIDDSTATHWSVRAAMLKVAGSGRHTPRHANLVNAITAGFPAGQNYGAVDLWEDRDGRTQADMLALLDSSIVAILRGWVTEVWSPEDIVSWEKEREDEDREERRRKKYAPYHDYV